MKRLNVGVGRDSVAPRRRTQDWLPEDAKPLQVLADVEVSAVPRLLSGLAEFDRVIGGGLVPGTVVLIGGQPGAGKSTLLLQLLERLDKPNLYVTGEESSQQVALRVQRLGLNADGIHILTETDVGRTLSAAQQLVPKVMVVDSIQVMHDAESGSLPGGITQVRECGMQLSRFAKESGAVLILIGHVTKDGTLAGPRVLEHMVDCSLFLDSSDGGRFRTLRGRKNRFGPADELGIFAMTDRGLREVKNPSAIFLRRAEVDAPGSVVVILWEGTRPLLLEVQALVDSMQSGNPRRLAVGLDAGRLSMLLAILHRHGGLETGSQDVYVNAVGGVRAQETGADLAILLAVASSLRDRSLKRDLVVFGEVGLGGEVRPVTGGQERLAEAAKHGFHHAIIPQGNMPRRSVSGMKVVGVGTVAAALEAAAELEI